MTMRNAKSSSGVAQKFGEMFAVSYTTFNSPKTITVEQQGRSQRKLVGITVSGRGPLNHRDGAKASGGRKVRELLCAKH